MKNADFIRRIDAKKALADLSANLDAEAVQRCIDALGRVKTADVVPVVRCQDCIHGETCTDGSGTPCIGCWYDGGYDTPIHSPRWFCAAGERRESVE